MLRFNRTRRAGLYRRVWRRRAASAQDDDSRRRHSLTCADSLESGDGIGRAEEDSGAHGRRAHYEPRTPLGQTVGRGGEVIL